MLMISFSYENVKYEVSELICSRKNDYYNQQTPKLNDPKASSKTYWSILETTFLTAKSNL